MLFSNGVGENDAFYPRMKFCFTAIGGEMKSVEFDVAFRFTLMPRGKIESVLP